MRLSLILLCGLLSCVRAEYTIPRSLGFGYQNLTKIQLLNYNGTYANCNGYRLSMEIVLTAAHCVMDVSWLGVFETAEQEDQLVILSRVRRYEVVATTANDLAYLAPYPISPQAEIPSIMPLDFGQSDTVFYFDKDFRLHETTILGFECVRTNLGTELCAWVVAGTPTKGSSGSPFFDWQGNLIGIWVAGSPTLGLIYFSQLSY